MIQIRVKPPGTEPATVIEHESGPGQLEFTFSPMEALAAADAMLLFRTLTKQVLARSGYHASFMALPGLPGFDPSGCTPRYPGPTRVVSSGEASMAAIATSEMMRRFAIARPRLTWRDAHGVQLRGIGAFTWCSHEVPCARVTRVTE